MMNTPQALDVWKFVAPEIVFGPETRHLAGRYARNFGLRKVLVVTDPGVMAAGWTKQVTTSLEEAGISYGIFSEVIPNPPAENVMAGAEYYERAHCNGIVAVGGGSPMDCAKGIGIVSANRKHILEFEGVDEVPFPGPPLICVPTTAGSSADVSQYAIITDKQHRNKVAIVSKAIVPDVALIDPVMTTTMSSYLTACTGIDALSHAIEAFVSNAHSPVTDLHALEAIRLIRKTLTQVFADPDNIDLRTKQMMASLQAGLAFSNAGLGAVHALSHSLGGLTDLAHGECNAILLGPVIAFNFDSVAERYRLIGEAMGLDLVKLAASDQKAALVDEVNRLRNGVGLSRSLKKTGVNKGDIPELVRKAVRDICIATNPRRPEQRDVEVILEEAF